jgi:hypothetical protein
MSRFSRVRPKKHQKQQQRQAAPEQASQGFSKRLEEVAAKFYGYMGGDEIDASIARWRKVLAVHDREVAKLAEGEVEGGYRWTVSPAMAFRIDKYLHSLLEQRAALKTRSYDEAEKMLAEGKDNSLCPPKPVSDAEVTTSAPANTGGTAEPVPIAA